MRYAAFRPLSPGPNYYGISALQALPATCARCRLISSVSAITYCLTFHELMDPAAKPRIARASGLPRRKQGGITGRRAREVLMILPIGKSAIQLSRPASEARCLASVFLLHAQELPPGLSGPPASSSDRNGDKRGTSIGNWSAPKAWFGAGVPLCPGSETCAIRDRSAQLTVICIERVRMRIAAIVSRCVMTMLKLLVKPTRSAERRVRQAPY